MNAKQVEALTAALNRLATAVERANDISMGVAPVDLTDTATDLDAPDPVDALIKELGELPQFVPGEVQGNPFDQFDIEEPKPKKQRKPRAKKAKGVVMPDGPEMNKGALDMTDADVEEAVFAGVPASERGLTTEEIVALTTRQLDRITPIPKVIKPAPPKEKVSTWTRIKRCLSRFRAPPLETITDTSDDAVMEAVRRAIKKLGSRKEVEKLIVAKFGTGKYRDLGPADRMRLIDMLGAYR